MNAETLLALAARCEAAPQRDMALGREVMEACGWRKSSTGFFLGPIYRWSRLGDDLSFDDDKFYQHDPTAYLDAAMTLVPRDCGGGDMRVTIERLAEPLSGNSGRAILLDTLNGTQASSEARTPALALTAACLRARAAAEQAS